MTIPMHLYRHDEIVIYRPFACDVDANDWLWQGTSHNRLLGHNLRTAELRVIEIPEMEEEVAFSVFSWQDKLFLLFGNGDFYIVYDVATGRTQRYELPKVTGVKPITWYGSKLPNGKLMVFDRGAGHALIFDAPDASPRIVPCPWEGDFAAGSVLSDGLVYTFLADPARVIRFDPDKEQFIDEQAAPWPDSGIGRGFEHNGVLYCSDTAEGRLLPFDIKTQQWGEPICHPDYGKVFGYLGLGFAFGGKGYYSLSTYMARSRIDRATGKIIGPSGKIYEPGDKLPTVDGRDLRFMERYLVFDPETQSFEYLIAPTQHDGLPLLCYSWNDETRMLITGFVLPWGEDGHPQAMEPGPWLIWQTEAAQTTS
jgi:hypothetical protein